jgi:putative transposase
MKKDNILNYENPSRNIIKDELSEFIRNSAQEMLKIAIETEVEEFMKDYKQKLLSNGHKQVVRNGYLPNRKIQTGVGNISVSVPRVRDRLNDGISFSSSLIPQYMRRTVSLDVLLPILYLKGISTGDFKDAFVPILGHGAKNLSPQVICKLKEGWYENYLSWQERDLSNKEYAYMWVDGVYLKARMESEKNCILVIIGADKNGKKEIVAINDGFRESKESWRDLLLDLQSRGLKSSPKLAVGDGALGFWGALDEIYPETKQQRCWVHKTRNILNKLPKLSQEKAKEMLHNIYLSETKHDALNAYDDFINRYGAKYPKVAECLLKDKNQLFSFYDFPAEHFIHLRTTNPIESTFATVKHRARKSRNCFSRKTIIASTFKLLLEAEKRWLPLRGRKRIAEVINLDKFIDGINQKDIDKNYQNFNNSVEVKYAA